MRAKLRELAWWAIKWAVAAVIIVYAAHAYQLLQHHNQLVSALTNWVRQVQAQQK